MRATCLSHLTELTAFEIISYTNRKKLHRMKCYKFSEVNVKFNYSFNPMAITILPVG